MVFFIYLFLLSLIYSIPTKTDADSSLKAAHEAALSSLRNPQFTSSIINHNFEETSSKPPSEQERDYAVKLLETERKTHPAIPSDSLHILTLDQILKRRAQIAKELKKLNAELQSLQSSVANEILTFPIISSNAKDVNQYHRRVSNSPFDLNPLNFRNSPENVASKVDWNHISQLLDDGRDSAVPSYSQNLQNDRILVRPIPRYQRIQNPEELGRLVSADDKVIKNLPDNFQDHGQFENDRKRKMPASQLSGVSPSNFRKALVPKDRENYVKKVLENVESNEYWKHYLQLSEANRETHSAVHPNSRHVLEDKATLLRPAPTYRRISNIGDLGKKISEESSLSISKDVSKDIASNSFEEIVTKLPRFL